jgi:hypothetical protein
MYRQLLLVTYPAFLFNLSVLFCFEHVSHRTVLLLVHVHNDLIHLYTMFLQLINGYTIARR